MKARFKQYDKLKMLLINISLFICLIGLITYTVMDRKGMFDETDGTDVTDETEFVDTVVEREKYDRLMEFIKKVKTPTLYDKEEVNPFTNVVAGHMGGEVSTNYVEYTVQNEKFNHNISYTALSSLPEYEELTKKAKPVFKEGSTAVYESEGVFFWYDDESKVYYIVKAIMDATQPIEVTTTEEGEVTTTGTDTATVTEESVPVLTKKEVKKIVASLGNSKFEPNKALETYSAETPILQPTYYVDGKVASQITMESVPNAYTVVHLIYDKYSITQSNNVDYTTLVDKEKAEKIDLGHDNAVIYLGEDKKQYYYKDEHTGISLVLNVQGDEVSVEEVTNVIHSTLHESEGNTEENIEGNTEENNEDK